ncbi:MAG: glycerol-3-phosphate 1-O-acyltransferase PlsY [Verrucomicrobiia bacterium]
MKIFSLLSIAFFIGSIPFGFLIAKAKGVDIRKQGSGNIGATNVGRVLGKKWGTLVFILDVLKGTGAVALGLFLFSKLEKGSSPQAWFEVGLGLAVVLGHNYCPWLKGKGGKGIATSLGVLMIVFPYAAMWALGAWLVAFAMTYYVSVGSLAASSTLIVSGLYYYGWSVKGGSCLFLGVMAVIRHRSNIVRLLQGKEFRSFSKKD